MGQQIHLHSSEVRRTDPARRKRRRLTRRTPVPVQGRALVRMCLPALGIITAGLCLCLSAPAAPYRSPLSVAVSPDGKTLYVSDKTAGCVARLDAATGDTLGETPVAGEPHGLALSADGRILYVAQRKINSKRAGFTRSPSASLMWRPAIGWRPCCWIV